jgi:DNA-binding CsgD family transcriptional regulator
MLEGFGLDPAAEALYVLLLREPDLDESELRTRSRLGTRELRALVAQLSDLGLVRADASTPSGTAVVRPDVSIEALLASQQAEVVEAQRRIAEARDAMQSLDALFHAGQQRLGAAAELEMVTGLDRIRQRLNEFARTATRSAYVMEPTPELAVPATYERLIEGELDVLVRGLDSRSLVASHVVAHQFAYQHYVDIYAAGEQIRHVPVVPLRMVLFDREIALVPIDPDETGRGALVIRAVSLVGALVELFDLVWDAATPLFDEDPVDAESLDATDRRLLRMLANGVKDEAIARQLGLGLRTVRRRVADLMAQLDVSTRFQAGVEAHRRGWLG